MPNRRRLLWFVFACGSFFTCDGQTPLAKAFNNLKSKDPQVSAAAQVNIAAVFSEEVASIEKDTHLLCSSLHDSNPLVRRHGAALLYAIVLASPEHSKVVVACFPDLVAASDDADKTTRVNILSALAMAPGGPPSAALSVFVKELDSLDDRTSQVAATGLLRAGGERKLENEKLVKAKLDNALDTRHRYDMLHAIAYGGVQSEALLGSSRKFLYDADPDVQRVALFAVAAAGNKAEVTELMRTFAASPSTSTEAKRLAQTIIDHQQESPANGDR